MPDRPESYRPVWHKLGEAYLLVTRPWAKAHYRLVCFVLRQRYLSEKGTRHA